MSKRSPTSNSRTALAPVLAAVALGLVAIALVVPMPSPTPPEITAPPEPGGPNTGPPPVPAEPAPTPDLWSSLAPKLDALVEMPQQPEATAVVEAAQPMPETAAAPVSMLPPLTWRFKGTVEGPGSIAALIINATGQSKLVFEGARITDEADPSGDGVLIREITKDHILVERKGQESTINYEPPQYTNEVLRQAAEKARRQRAER